MIFFEVRKDLLRAGDCVGLAFEFDPAVPGGRFDCKLGLEGFEVAFVVGEQGLGGAGRFVMEGFGSHGVEKRIGGEADDGRLGREGVGEGDPEVCGGLLEGFWHDGGAGDEGHEIYVAFPAGHEMDVEMFNDAGAGNLAEIDADIESLGFHDGSDGVLAASQELHEFEEFLIVEIVPIGGLPVRNDHEMAAVVRVCVEEGVAGAAPGDDVIGFVIGRLGDAGEERLIADGRLGAQDVVDAPRGVE